MAVFEKSGTNWQTGGQTKEEKYIGKSYSTKDYIVFSTVNMLNIDQIWFSMIVKGLCMGYIHQSRSQKIIQIEPYVCYLLGCLWEWYKFERHYAVLHHHCSYAFDHNHSLFDTSHELDKAVDSWRQSKTIWKSEKEPDRDEVHVVFISIVLINLRLEYA